MGVLPTTERHCLLEAGGLRLGCYEPLSALVMQFVVEVDREDDGRWIAELPELAGVLAYGTSREDAVARANALAVRVLADRLEQATAEQVEGVVTSVE